MKSVNSITYLIFEILSCVLGIICLILTFVLNMPVQGTVIGVAILIFGIITLNISDMGVNKGYLEMLIISLSLADIALGCILIQSGIIMFLRDFITVKLFDLGLNTLFKTAFNFILKLFRAYVRC